MVLMSDFFTPHLFLFLLPDLLETLQHLHLVRTELPQLPEHPGPGGLEDVAEVPGAGEGRGVTIGVGPALGEAGQHRQLTGDHHGVVTEMRE